MSIKHAFTNPKSDGADATIVRPSDWNADHSGSEFTGLPVAVLPQGGTYGSGTSTSAADQARACAIFIPSIMRVRALAVNISTSGAGSLTWGIFDYSSDPSSCTSLVEGTGAPGGTGTRLIAATSAPVVVNPGNYVLLCKNASSNPSTIVIDQPNSNMSHFGNQSSYTWTSTPDMTTGWNWTQGGFWSCYLVGDYDSSGNYWS